MGNLKYDVFLKKSEKLQDYQFLTATKKESADIAYGTFCKYHQKCLHLLEPQTFFYVALQLVDKHVSCLSTIFNICLIIPHKL